MKRYIVSFCCVLAIICLALTALADVRTLEMNVERKSDQAQDLLDLLNDYRRSGDAWQYDEAGNKIELGALPALELDPVLTAAAEQRAAELAVSFSHTRPDGSLCFSVNNDIVGENIAGYYNDPVAMFEAFAEAQYGYDGQGHRRNMLDPEHTHVGIATLRINNITYWTMEFSAGEPTSVSPVPERDDDDPILVTVDLDNPEILRSLKIDCDSLTVSVNESVPLPTVYLAVGGVPVEPVEAVWSVENGASAVLQGPSVVGKKQGYTTLACMLDGLKSRLVVYVPSVKTTPTATPTPVITAKPSPAATPAPTAAPTEAPTAAPTTVPTAVPTMAPTAAPSAEPAPCAHASVSSVVEKASTCSEHGVKANVCDACGEVLSRESLPLDPNACVFIQTVYRHDCGRSFELFTCIYCGSQYEGKQLTDGDCVFWDEIDVKVPPTYESEGSGEKICRMCGHVRTVTIPKLECPHEKHKIVITPATCEKDGSQVDCCERCGYVFSSEIIPKKGHEYDPVGELIREATCTVNGQVNRPCVRCGVIELIPLPPLGHDWVMYEDGSVVCSRCGIAQDDQ